MANSERPPFALKRAAVRARQAAPSLPDESGVGFALKRFAVRARRAQTTLPEWSAALLIGFHLAVVPTASFGVKLLQPVLEQRAAQQVSVARNADVLETPPRSSPASTTASTWTRGPMVSRSSSTTSSACSTRTTGCTPPSAG